MADDSGIPPYLAANSATPNDNTALPLNLAALGFPSGPAPASTPGINQTYPNQNQAPAVSDTGSTTTPGFFGSILQSVENAGSTVITDVEAAPGSIYTGAKNGLSTVVGGVESAAVSTYNGAKSVVSTVGGDVGGGLQSILGGVEKNVFLIFGVVVVGAAILFWTAGKSGAVHANVNAIV